MVSFFLLLFFIDLVFIGIALSVEGLFFLIAIFPWTLLLYGVLCYQGFRFSNIDPLHQLAGKLFFVGKGNVQGSIIAIVNVVLGALLVPNTNLTQFEDQFGPFTSILLFLVLPLPGFFINSLQTENQERLYGLIYQEMIGKDEKPVFIDQVFELLTNTKRYSDEYRLGVEQAREGTFKYLEHNFQQIAPYFHQTKSLRLNIENLAIFITKKSTEIPEI